jgi:histidine phosphotransferase ChpT
MDDRLHLAELLSARLCHDLSGLLGSLLGTLELLTADTAPRTEATTIAIDTATTLNRRLRLLRAAWAGSAEPLDLPRLTQLAQGLAARRIALDPDGLPATAILSSNMARLVANLLVLAADAMPRGGVLRLDGSATDLIARLNGPQAAWPPGFAGMLAEPATAWAMLRDPRTLQAPLTVLLAHESGLRLTLLHTGGPATAAPPLRLREP